MMFNKKILVSLFVATLFFGGCSGIGKTDEKNNSPTSEPTLISLTAGPTLTVVVVEASTDAPQGSNRSTPEGPMPPQFENCAVTPPDVLGPFYTPGAPERNVVGSGYTLSGHVLSVNGCVPIPGAKIELWMAGPDGVYTDEFRATIITGADGAYRFESTVPVPYENRPPHIHLKVTAPGYEDLVTQHYPAQGQTEAEFNLVLIPKG
jgi:protocatechuate 3,4-dioxygenase beta subunit